MRQLEISMGVAFRRLFALPAALLNAESDDGKKCEYTECTANDELFHAETPFSQPRLELNDLHCVRPAGRRVHEGGPHCS